MTPQICYYDDNGNISNKTITPTSGASTTYSFTFGDKNTDWADLLKDYTITIGSAATKYKVDSDTIGKSNFYL